MRSYVELEPCSSLGDEERLLLNMLDSLGRDRLTVISSSSIRLEACGGWGAKRWALAARRGPCSPSASGSPSPDAPHARPLPGGVPGDPGGPLSPSGQGPPDFCAVGFPEAPVLYLRL